MSMNGISVPMRELFPGVAILELDGQTRLASRAVDPVPVYGERIVSGWRIWDPFRSKLASMILGSGESAPSISRDSKVLYLGAATGTTVSHVSDILTDGLVYAVEFSVRSMRDLLRLCKRRENIVPILADASTPEAYAGLLEPVDLVYQDVAQREQAKIALMNCERYLRPGGDLILMLKSRSVDVTASPDAVLHSELMSLTGLDVLSVRDLLPFHQDHWAISARKPK